MPAHITNAVESYTYKGLPPLVGLMDMESASTCGLTVAESVDRLKRLHWAFRRLHGIFMAHLSSMSIYELKMAFSLHGHYCAEHVLHFAGRVREMRQPPYNLDNSPHPSIDIFFDEILCAPSASALVLGLYGHAIPAVHSALKTLLQDTSRLFDHPTYRILLSTSFSTRYYVRPPRLR